jgi:hypothetical protein
VGVELVGLARRKAQWHIRFRRRRSALDAPVQPRPKLGAWHGDLDRMLSDNEARSRDRLTLIRIFEELRGLGYEGSYDAVRRYAKKRSRVLEGYRSRPQNLAHRIPRYLQLAHDLLDRLALNEVLPTAATRAKAAYWMYRFIVFVLPFTGVPQRRRRV